MSAVHRLLLLLALTGITACGSLEPISLHHCGNHLVEDQETCDGDQGCIAPGQTNECQMQCGFYPNGVCPKGRACVGGGCLVQENVCGNGIIEGNETCDGDSGCIAPKQTNQCHMLCSAYAQGICPKGQACMGSGPDAACLPQPSVCGNGVVESGEDCDESSGCIAHGQPNECHMLCSAYSNRVCPAGKVCSDSGSDGACLTQASVCGNGVVENAEDCDESAGCIAPGQPNECHMLCSTYSNRICPIGQVCSDSGADGACLTKARVCGNQVVEDGEECDDLTQGCGRPNSGTQCLLICNPDPTHLVSCPAQYVCGKDLRCRRPTGTYTLGPAVGQSAYAQAADFDHDGAPDLVDKMLDHTELWHNDGRGQFVLAATGPTRVEPPFESMQIALAPKSVPTQTMAVVSSSAVDLYTWRNGTLLPFIAPSLVWKTAQPLQLIGVGQGVQGARHPLFLDVAGRRVVDFAGARGWRPMEPFKSVSLDVSCKLDPTLTVVTRMRIGPDGTSSFALVGTDSVGNLVACFGDIDPVSDLVRLRQLPSAGIKTDPQQPWISAALLDLDANQRLDLMVFAAIYPNQAQVAWLQTANGFVGPTIAPQNVSAIVASANSLGQSSADFDGDGREDLVSEFLYPNRTTGQESTFDWGGGFRFLATGPRNNYMAGDFNGDKLGDLLFTYWDGELIRYIGDGKLNFNAIADTTPWPMGGVLVGDFSGDGKDDLVLHNTADPRTIGVALGSATAPLVPLASTALAIDGTSLTGLGVAPPLPHATAKQLAATLLSTADGSQGLAISPANVTGLLSFGYPFAEPQSLAFGDYDGDHTVDLAVLNSNGSPGPRTLGLSILHGMLPFAIDQFALPANWSHAEFCALDDDGPPALCGYGDGFTFLARWNGSSYSAQTVPFSGSVQDRELWSLDLDGDGKKELVQLLTTVEVPTSSCTARVWHRASDGSLAATDSQLDTCRYATPVDLLPLDGLIDLQSAFPFRSYYLLRPDFTFVKAPSSTQLVVHDATGPANLSRFSWSASADFNGDGITDLFFRDLDGQKMRIAFADVVPPGQQPCSNLPCK